MPIDLGHHQNAQNNAQWSWNSVLPGAVVPTEASRGDGTKPSDTKGADVMNKDHLQALLLDAHRWYKGRIAIVKEESD